MKSSQAWVGLLVGVGAIVLQMSEAIAQSVIVPDGTLGNERAIVVENYTGGAIEAIGGGARRGQNLFHSFSQFNVSEGRSAYFFVPDNTVRNVLTRVTGNSASEIFGKLGTFQISDNLFTPSNANFFLVNPNGIIFGPNSNLDVGGSVALITANALQFPNGELFSATVPTIPSSVLSIAPSALLYNAINIQNKGIVVRTSLNNPNNLIGATTGLQLVKGKSLILAGGSVQIEGGILQVPGGRVEIASVASPGRIEINTNGSLNILNDIQRADVLLTKNALIATMFENTGDIVITARNITLKERSGLYTGISQNLGSTTSKAGDIILNATENVNLSEFSIISNVVPSQATGSAGNIFISTGSLSLNKSDIDSSAVGQGNAGNIILKVEDKASFTGNSRLFSNIGSPAGQRTVGNVGNILLTAQSVLMSEKSQIQAGFYANTEGQSGVVSIQAKDSVVFTGANTGIFNNTESGVVGNGSDIKIVAKSVTLNGAELLTRSAGKGNSGSINISTDSLDIRDSFMNTSVSGKGLGGNVTLTARDRVSFDNSEISSLVNLGAVGSSGNILISTGLLNLNKSDINNSAVGRGNAGNIILNVGGNASFTGNSRLLSNVGSPRGKRTIGNVGNILLTAQSVLMSENSQIQAGFYANTEGQSGRVSIRSKESVIFTGSNTGIFNNAESGVVGNGSDIQIVAKSVSLQDGAEFFTGSSGKGNSGSINISADRLDIKNSSMATSISGKGLGGNIIIEAHDQVLIDNSIILSILNFGATGSAGNILIKTGLLNLNASDISNSAVGRGSAGNIILNVQGQASFTGNSRITSNVGGPALRPTIGNVGNILLTAQSVLMSETSQLQAGFFANTAGNAGLVSVQAKDSIVFTGNNTGVFTDAERGVFGNGSDIQISGRAVTLQDGSGLVARSTGNGSAGNVLVQASDFIILKDANIRTDSVRASGGDLTMVSPTIKLLGDSNLVTTVRVGNGQGGNITLNANSVIALNDSDILTFALQGKGGNVTLNTSAFFGQNYRPAPFGTDPRTLDGNDRVDINASGSLSSGTITTPDTSFIQNSLNQLPKDTIDTTKLLANTCIVRKDKPEGTFYITGTGGLPNRPGDPALSNYPTNTVAPTQTAVAPRSVEGHRPWQKGDPIVEPTGFYTLANGRLVMSRECSN